MAVVEPDHGTGAAVVGAAPRRGTVSGVDRVGLVGLPNSGKSSLFNALTGGDAVVASHPFSTIETEVGVAHVPAPRVDALAKMSESRKIVYVGFEVVDIAAIGKGGEKGDALGGRFLAGVREVDALCLVLRSFEDDNVPGDCDPLAALSVIELELVLADMATLEQQLTKKRSRIAPVDPAVAAGLKAAPAALSVLEQGTPLYRSSLRVGDREALRPFFLLTDKPTMAVVNVGEDELATGDELVSSVEKEVGSAVDVLAVSVQLEAEAARLDPDDETLILEVSRRLLQKKQTERALEIVTRAAARPRPPRRPSSSAPVPTRSCSGSTRRACCSTSRGCWRATGAPATRSWSRAWITTRTSRRG